MFGSLITGCGHRHPCIRGTSLECRRTKNGTQADASRLPPTTVRTVVGTREPESGVVILDVDDEDQCFALATWLREKGHAPLIGSADHRTLLEQSLPVVGIVTDRIERLDFIKFSHPRALCVALTGTEEADEAKRRGADFVIPKPFRLELLR